MVLSPGEGAAGVAPVAVAVAAAEAGPKAGEALAEQAEQVTDGARQATTTSPPNEAPPAPEPAPVSTAKSAPTATVPCGSGLQRPPSALSVNEDAEDVDSLKKGLSLRLTRLASKVE